jgi:outer membrane protein insertion porin family
MGHSTMAAFRPRLRGLLAWLTLRLIAPAAAADPETAPVDRPGIVERVEVRGNQRIPAETLLFYVSTKPGDGYDPLRLRQDFRRLWDTGFIEDLVLSVSDGSRGKVATFVVTERARIQIVDYRGAKSLTTTQVEDRLKEKNAALRLDSFYDLAKARRVEAIIQEMLAEKGHPFARVKHDAKPVGPAGVQVAFVVDEGPRTRVRRIEFVGNEAFSDRALRGRMKKIKAAGGGAPWSVFTAPLRWGKTTYHPEKWSDPREGDKARLEGLYLDHGYVMAGIGDPEISYVDAKSGFFRKKPVKWVELRIPVREGERYRMGELKFEGLTLFKEEAVRPLFRSRPGDVYTEKRLTKAYDKLRDFYGAQGYFQWTVATQRTPDPQRKVVDVTVKMDEDRRYYVGRIGFVGNDTTRDKVIRREVYLNEDDVFSTEALKASIRRINQLGYFKPMETPPEITPSDRGEDRLDLTFKVEEQNRNQFTFGGGISGLEGAFLNASFATSNFLGLGETLQLSAQTGGRTNNYQASITEPYLFDRPLSAGIDLYSRKLDYLTSQGVVGYSEVRTGASFVAGLPLGRFTRLFGNYTYEVIETAALDSLLGQTDGAASNGEPIFSPFLDEGRNRESRVSPSMVFNTVDNPYAPRRGQKLSGILQVAGGPLGGTVSYLKPNVEAVFYVPHTRRTALGLRGELGWIGPFGATARLPYYQRYFLGGETQIRGVNVHTVGPVDAENRAVGGNKFVLFNAEYYFDVAGPLRALVFYDAGQAFAEGRNINLRQLRSSAGAELRFIMPVLNVPFRLIYAFNLSRDAFQPARTFKFAVGTTF